jgi:superfamily II DNA helicase RecQ
VILEGDDAFAALRAMARHDPQPAWRAPVNPAFDRFRRAWTAPHRRSPLELAVLLRQALVHEAARRQSDGVSVALAPGSPLQDFQAWKDVGLNAQRLADGWLVSELPWSPSWASEPAGEPLDAFAAAERIRPAAEHASCAGDPFLELLGHTRYQSVGQRAAVRSALTTPPGATLAVSLATGEGKSLIFQLIARVGFAGSEPSEPGLTLVVVPTVALAIDHENAALEKGLEAPISYRGADYENNQALISRIDEDAQALCVASPEAVCGPLRRSLTAAAKRGRLRALVVDEAHLIDGWGTGFRTEFQSLSGLRNQWIRGAPPGTAARTILISATLTAATLNMLRTLFAGPGEFQSVSALRLRGEPDYWTVACPTEADRESRVLEALRHVPRPAILYVTRVVDADAWRSRLVAEGFTHVELVHGETGAGERDRILRAWRDGDVDLVVATSAFGLGIDYRHVRAVVHACVPESLDRFYQEVGRGGRDGRSCLALTLYTRGDDGIAERISKALVISIDRGRQRWGAMFEQRIPTDEPDTYILPLDVAPSQEPEDIDMRGERNSDWNARVLTLMARAGMVQLLGAPVSSNERVGRHEVVRVLDLEHRREATWRRRVQPVRDALAMASQNNLALMRQLLAAQACPAPLLLSLYSAGPEAHACGRCSACRTDATRRQPERPRLEPTPPWLAPRALAAGVAELLDANRRLVVWYDPSRQDWMFRRRMGEIVQALYKGGIFNAVLLRAPSQVASDVRAACRELAMFVTEVGRLTQRRLPQGPEFVVAGLDAPLERLDLSPRPPGAEQIFLLPESLEDPTRPGVLLAATYAGRRQSFDAFFRRVCA